MYQLIQSRKLNSFLLFHDTLYHSFSTLTSWQDMGHVSDFQVNSKTYLNVYLTRCYLTTLLRTYNTPFSRSRGPPQALRSLGTNRWGVKVCALFLRYIRQQSNQGLFLIVQQSFFIFTTSYPSYNIFIRVNEFSIYV